MNWLKSFYKHVSLKSTEKVRFDSAQTKAQCQHIEKKFWHRNAAPTSNSTGLRPSGRQWPCENVIHLEQRTTMSAADCQTTAERVAPDCVARCACGNDDDGDTARRHSAMSPQKYLIHSRTLRHAPPFIFSRNVDEDNDARWATHLKHARRNRRSDRGDDQIQRVPRWQSWYNTTRPTSPRPSVAVISSALFPYLAFLKLGSSEFSVDCVVKSGLSLWYDDLEAVPGRKKLIWDCLSVRHLQIKSLWRN